MMMRYVTLEGMRRETDVDAYARRVPQDRLL